MSSFYDYRDGTDVVAHLGKMKAYGHRVLLYTFKLSDVSQTIHIADGENSNALAYCIIDIGGAALKEMEKSGQVLEIGQHCQVRSEAMDRVPGREYGRFWNVHHEDIIAVWDPVPKEETDTFFRQEEQKTVLIRKPQIILPETYNRG